MTALDAGELDRLEALAAEATPGPWHSQPIESAVDGRINPDASVYGPDGDTFAHLQWNPGNDYDMHATGAFIAACDPDTIRRLVAAAREPLDAAWREAEAALPEGYSVGVTKTVKVASGPYVATTDFGPAEHGYAYGSTPAAALLALAAALRKPVTA